MTNQIVQYRDTEIIFDGTTAYMSQAQIAKMLDISRNAVSKALSRAHERGFIDLDSATYNLSHTASDGKIYNVKHYPTHAILLVGFRIEKATENAIAFQEWITGIVDGHINDLYHQLDETENKLSEETRRADYAQQDLNDRLGQEWDDYELP